MNKLHLSSWDNATLFDALLGELKVRFGHIPTRGIIAGQAVASACYRVTGLFEHGPMNDLDVFGTEDQLPTYFDPSNDVVSGITYDASTGKYVRRRISRKAKIKRFDGLSTMEVSECSLGFMLNDSASEDGYSIINSFRDLVHFDINYIEVGHSSYTTLDGRMIIEGFDINACEIALEMDTGNVVWTDAFQNFLFRPWLSCTYLGTPMHTAIRLCKKMSALPFAQVNLDEEMKKLQSSLAVISYYSKCKAHDRMPGNILSAVYASRFNDVQHVIEPYFTLHEHRCVFENQIVNEESETFDFLASEPMSVSDETTERLMYRLQPTNYDHFAVDSFIKAWFSQRDTPIPAVYTAINLEDISRLFKTWYVHCQDMHGRRDLEKVLRALSLSEKCSAMSRAFVLMRHLKNRLRDVRQASDQSIARLYRMACKHPLAFSRVTQDILQFGSDIQIANQFRWLEKNNMHYYIGWLENGVLDSDDRTILLSNGRANDDNFDYPGLLDKDFRAKMKPIHNAFISTLKSRFFSPQIANLLRQFRNDEPGIDVFELTSEYDFYWEGQSMRHCVGGHYESSKNMFGIVVSINTAPNSVDVSSRSTLQFRFIVEDDVLQVFVSQHHSVGNTWPADENTRVAQLLADRINQTLATYGEDNPPVDGGDFFDSYHVQHARRLELFSEFMPRQRG